MGTFNPPKAERYITAKITCKEAHLLKVLRPINFGKIVVQKMNGQLIRVEPVESVMLTEEGGLTLVDIKVL